MPSSGSIALRPRVIDQEESRGTRSKVVAPVCPTAQGRWREQESFTLPRPEHGVFVVELVLDLPPQHVAAMALLAPLLPGYPLSILDESPAGAPYVRLPGTDSGGVVGPGKLLE